MKLPLYLSVSLCLTLYQSTQAVIILVHGTWAQESSWYQSHGEFYRALKKTHPPVVPFTWAASNTHEARTKAAANLAELIMSYPSDTEIILIGHSHGGNVINLASHQLPSCKKPIIKAVFSLATPVSNQAYYPNMNAIENYYHLFSLNDSIQTVFGLFQRTYTSHERIFNCRVLVNRQEIDHHGFHHATVGESLMHLPSMILQQKSKNLVTHFISDKHPEIYTDEDQENLIATSTQAIAQALDNISRSDNKKLGN